MPRRLLEALQPEPGSGEGVQQVGEREVARPHHPPQALAEPRRIVRPARVAVTGEEQGRFIGSLVARERPGEAGVEPDVDKPAPAAKTALPKGGRAKSGGGAGGGAGGGTGG